MSARHLKRLDTLSRLYAFNFPHIANKQRPKEESHTERTEKGGQNPEAILTEEENRVLLKTNPGASSALYDACS